MERKIRPECGIASLSKHGCVKAAAFVRILSPNGVIVPDIEKLDKRRDLTRWEKDDTNAWMLQPLGFIRTALIERTSENRATIHRDAMLLAFNRLPDGLQIEKLRIWADEDPDLKLDIATDLIPTKRKYDYSDITMALIYCQSNLDFEG